MSAYTTPGLDRWLDPSIMDGIYADMEAREDSIRSRIESSTEEFSEAVSEYYDSLRVELDGHDLLTDFTIALVGFDAIAEKLFHGDALTDGDNIALRALGLQIKEAKRRAADAVQAQVDMDVLA
jgi:hypothetical protein